MGREWVVEELNRLRKSGVFEENIQKAIVQAIEDVEIMDDLERKLGRNEIMLIITEGSKSDK